jgi:hypothetical protein
MRMELLLLLQEIQEQRGTSSSNPLMSPLPFPTSLPLLSAAAAGSKSVVADPLQHLQCMIRDLLHTVVEFNKPPDEKTSRSKVCSIFCFFRLMYAFTVRSVLIV